MNIHAVEQGSEAWMLLRAGIPTASEFAKVIAKGKGKAPSMARQNYLYQLAAEIITGQVHETHGGADTRRGHDMEPEARSLYEFTFDAEVQQVGFIRNGRKGCSPDGLVGTAGGIEIKSKLPRLMVETICDGVLPEDHRAQVQGCLWVAEREWWDFAAFWPRFPLFTVRAYRDEPYIAALSLAVDEFNVELDGIVAKVRAYGGAP